MVGAHFRASDGDQAPSALKSRPTIHSGYWNMEVEWWSDVKEETGR